MTRYKLPAETDMETNLEDCSPPPRSVQESPSGSECASTANIKSEGRGPTPTSVITFEAKLLHVINEAHTRGFTCKSAFAREYAELVAAAASLQLITTRISKHLYGNEWQVTVKGLRWLNEMKESK